MIELIGGPFDSRLHELPSGLLDFGLGFPDRFGLPSEDGFQLHWYIKRPGQNVADFDVSEDR